MNCILITGASLLVAAVRLVAQQEAADSAISRVFELGAVEVTVEQGQRTPGSLTVGVEEMRDHARRDLGGVLRLLPGVAAAGFGARNETMVVVRGFDLRQVPIFMDGIPVYVPYDGYVDLGRFTTYDAAEIRLSRGFSSVLYGPNAMGGAINVLSRRPIEPIELEFGTGAFTGEGRELYGNVGGRRDDFWVQTSASVIRQVNFRLPSDAGEGLRANSDRRDVRATMKAGWRPATGSELVLGLTTQQGRKGVPPYAGADPRERPRYWRWPEWDKSGAYLVGTTTAGSRASLGGRIYYDTFDNALFSYDDATYTSQTRPFAFQSYYDDYTVGGTVESGLEIGDSHLLKAAANLKEDTHRENNLGQPVRTLHDRTVSLAIEHTFRSGASSVVTGVSAEHRETLRAEDLVSGAVSSFPLGDGAAFNPQIGVFRVLETGTLRLTAARKTRFPTIKDRYSYRLGTATPNPDLAAESAVHLEAGYGRETDRLRLDVAIFDLEISDQIQQVDSVMRSPAGDYLWQFRNVGRARRFGLDLSAHATVVRGMEVGANYSFIEADNLTDPAIRLPGVPRHRGFGFVELTPVAWATILGSVDATGRRFGTSSGLELDRFVLVDLRGALRPRQDLEIGIAIRNLFDEAFELTSGFPEPGRTMHVDLSYAIGGGVR